MITVRRAIPMRTWPLASIRMSLIRGGCHWNRRVLGRAQIAGRLALVDGPHPQFVQHTVAPGVKLHGLADVAIFFLDGLVVGGNVERELAPLGIGLLQLQAYR